MATPSENGRQVRLSVDLWYDPGTKRMHLTNKSAHALLAKFGKLPDGI